MEKIVVVEEYKKKIYEHIQSSIGFYIDYEEEIENFYANGMLNKELATRVLENLIYFCKVTKFQLKPNEEFKDEKRKTDEIWKHIPKCKDFHEDDAYVYVRDSDVEEYNDMSIEEIYSNVKKCLEVEETYQKIYSIQNLRQRANCAIESINSIWQHEIDVLNEDKEELTQLGEELKELLSESTTDINAMQDRIQVYNQKASKIWKVYLSNDTQQPRWLVHNLSRGSFEGDFNKKYMSTSFITSKTMGLFNEKIGNNFGFIIKPMNIISASECDTFTNNSPVNEYMQAFSVGNMPTIKLPWEIELNCMKQTIENSGEMLNYDNRTVYSEVVVDEFEIEAMYYRSNGEGELAPNYEMAKKMAEERGVELKELDISKAREEQGLETMTEGMQKNFLRNILRKNFMKEEQIEQIMWIYDRSGIEEQWVEKYYKKFYQKYLQFRNNGNYSKEDILQEFHTMLSDKEIEEMNNFYEQKKEEIEERKNYDWDGNYVDVLELKEYVPQKETELWTNRFKKWYGIMDKIPEEIRGKFVKMKSDIVKVIKSRLKERDGQTQDRYR